MRDLRSPALRRLLTELKSVQPDSAWVTKNRERLLQKVGGEQAVQVSLFQRVSLMVRSLVPTPARSLVRGPVAAVLSGIGLIVGGSMASVSASEQSVPGDLLFPVKLVSEQTRLVLATDKKDRVRLKGEFVNRRVEEIKKIAQTDVGKKPERLKEATEILRRDLDTVKNQLSDVSGDKPSDRVEVARIVDKAGTDVVAGLKEARASLPSDARSDVAEVEAAAVNASVKAVNVILDSQTRDEEAKKLVSKEELIQSISQKVDGVSEHINNATRQLADVGILTATATTALASSSTTTQFPANSTSSVAEILSAHASLTEARDLLLQDRLSEAGDKLVEASKSASNAERSVESLVQAVTNGSTGTSSTTNTGKGLVITNSSTPAIVASSSPPLPATSPPASTTEMNVPTTSNQKK